MIALLLAAWLVLGAAPARAQVAPLPSAGLTTDGDVQALAVSPGNVVHLGGAFSSLATRTGHWVRLGATGARDAAWPEVDGPVVTAVPDGDGGWFLAGAFGHVGGQPRTGLAHVGPTGALDPDWAPRVDMTGSPPGYSLVRALCVLGGTVYVGGEFAAIDGRPRGGLAAIDAVSGRVRDWAPRVDGPVDALAAAAGTIVAGGEFTHAGSARREHLASFDAVTGALTAWRPAVRGEALPGAPVTAGALAVDGGTLYVSGRFDAVGTRRRPGLAAFDVATGTLSAWNPRAVAWAMAGEGTLEVARGTVYASGAFGYVCAGDRSLVGVLAVDAGASAGVRWCADARRSASGWVHDVAVVGDRVYVGGEFTSLAGRRHANLDVLDADTGAPRPWAAVRPNGPVTSLVAAGDGVLAGGGFDGLWRVRRHDGAVLDLDTGVLGPFEVRHREVLPTEGIDALAALGRSVFAAGDFFDIGGRDRRSLAKLDAGTGRARRWDARLGRDGRPHALAVHGRRLLIGGDFRRVGNRPRRGLAAVDTRTGRVTRWRADVDGRVEALSIDGHTLYVAGAFTRVDGRRRRHVAAVDLRTGRVTAWHPDPGGPVRALAVAGEAVLLGVDAGRRRGRVVAVDAGPGARRRWRVQADARVHALAVVEGTLYAGGDFTSIAGARRERLAALDVRGGVPFAWDPGANDRVAALLTTPAGLVAAGSFSSLGGAGQTGFGVFARVPGGRGAP